MMKDEHQVISDKECRDLILWYLEESGGDLLKYHQSMTQGQRMGQAFFNAMTREDQMKVSRTLWDPFYKTFAADIYSTISFLTKKTATLRS